MTSFGYNVLGFGTASTPPSAAGYAVSNSLRFNPGDSAHMDLTFGTPTSQKAFTLSWWLKRGNPNESNCKIFSCTDGNDHQMQFLTAGNLSFVDATGTVNQVTTQKFLDTSAWYNFVWSMDTSRGNGNRSQIFVNGVRITSFSTDNQPDSGADVPGWNSACAHKIGEDHNGGNFYSGLLAEIVWIDGQGLLANSFGEFDSNGGWRAISIADQSLTFGDNGYYLEMKILESSGNGPGTDTSGEANHWAASGIADNDTLLDSPADDADNFSGNYAVMSPISPCGVTLLTLTNGNLTAHSEAGSYEGAVASIPFPTTGKWGVQITLTGSVGSSNEFQICLGRDAAGVPQQSRTHFAPADAGSFTMFGLGNLSDGVFNFEFEAAGVQTHHTATAPVSGDVLEYLYDADNNTMQINVEGSAYGSALGSIPANVEYWLCISAFDTECDVDFGQQGYEPSDSDYKTLCTANLPEPAIKDPSAAMNAQTFTGTGAENVRAFGGNTALSPNAVWVKDHSGSSDWNFVDTIRGATKEMPFSSAAGENTVAQGVKSFNADGVTLGTDGQYNTNTSPNTLVGFKEGATEGFDIVTYTGNASGTQSISHSLGVKPGFIMVMRRDTGAATFAWHTALTGDNFNIPMSTTGRGTETSSSSYFAATHNASVFVVDNAGNTENGTYVAYVFADVPGYQRHGSYLGNAAADGSFVWCGFRPRAIFIRRFDGERNGYWYDTAQNTFNTVTDGIIFGRDAVMETSLIDIDILSNGFKFRVSSADINGAVPKNLFSAWGEAPFGGENVSQSRAR